MIVKSMTARILTSIVVTLGMEPYAQAETFENHILNMIFSGASETEKEECLSFAEQNAANPNRFTGNYAQQYIGLALQCMNKRKTNQWAEYRHSFLNRNVGEKTLSVYSTSEPKISELSALPSYYSDRLDEGETCEITRQKKVNIDSITYRTSQNRGIITVNSEIKQTGFIQDGNKVSFIEEWTFSDFSSSPKRRITRFDGVLDSSIKIENHDYSKFSNPERFVKAFAKLANPGDVVTFSTLMEYRRNETTYTQPIISQIRFDGCASVDVNGDVLATRVYSISDPYIVPSFMKEGQLFEPLQTRTRVLEFSTDLNWPVSFAYIDDRISMARAHVITRSK